MFDFVRFKTFIKVNVSRLILYYVKFKNKIFNEDVKEFAKESLIHAEQIVKANMLTSVLVLIAVSLFSVFIFQNLIVSKVESWDSNQASDISSSQNIFYSKNIFDEETNKSFRNKVGQAGKSTVGMLNSANSSSAKKTNLKADAVSSKRNFSSNGDTLLLQDTIEGRDIDREIVTQLLADNISYYYFLHKKLPQIYKNKSRAELGMEPANVVYFYNADENKTNALALTLGTNEGMYKFVRIDSCNKYEKQQDIIAFMYKDYDVTLCKENGSQQNYWVAN